MANTYRLGLEIIAQRFPGLCALNEDVTQTQGRRVKYFLEFRGKAARELLELILPHLYFKSAAAGIGIAYQKWKDKHPFMTKGLASEQRSKIKENRSLTYGLLKIIHRKGRLNRLPTATKPKALPKATIELSSSQNERPAPA